MKLFCASVCGVAMVSLVTLSGQTPTFRGAVDLIAVDVQVVDRAGLPIAALGPDAFTVTIDGKRRRVVSADLVTYDERTRASQALAPATASAPTMASHDPVTAGPGRVIIVAVDTMSINGAIARGVFAEASAYVNRLAPQDLVGLFAYPLGPRIDPSADHARVANALATLLSQRESSLGFEFNLSPSDLVDLSMGRAPELIRQLCPISTEYDTCAERLALEVQTSVLYHEGQANASVGMLRGLIRELAKQPGRKTLVLVSAGLIGTDVPGGRPDIGDIGLVAGREAALANVSVYTLFVDQTEQELNAAETRRARNRSMNVMRDAQLMGRWLDHFAGSAGGTFTRVLAGRSESAFDRILQDTSSYYLLGVEPAESDRDGRAHEIHVRTGIRNATVRGRSWVMVPKRGTAIATGAAPTPRALGAPPPAAPMEALPVTRDVRALSDVYDRATPDAWRSALSEAPDPANLIRSFRLGGDPWPTSRHRTAAFALELALAGLRSDNGFANDEGTRLLAEYSIRVRTSATADTFECAWLETQAAGLQGLMQPVLARWFVTQALDRCADRPRLHLARAVIADQDWELVGRDVPAAERAAATAKAVTSTLAFYERAMSFPETRDEARARAAWTLCRAGRCDEGAALLTNLTISSDDVQVQYLVRLLHGQILRARGDLPGAAARFQSALDLWPGAQGARVGLMTVRAAEGAWTDAASLAEAIQSSPGDQFDPWWLYWLGDYRNYGGLIARLRAMSPAQ